MSIAQAPAAASSTEAPDAGVAGSAATRHRWFAAALVAAAVVVVAAGVLLRFWAQSDLWLDEALTVNIAHLPIGRLHGALRHDGAPPLYYVLLHYWMAVFGTSDLAVRSLSGVMGVATLPLAWVLGRRLGGRLVGASALVLMASSPFAVRYSTENRMYALVVLLVAAGGLCLVSALARPRWPALAGVALCTAALLYSHYWALYLVATVALWLAWRAWRAPERRGAAVRVLVAVAVGCLAFVPWAPTFAYQSAHTGTPWAQPASFAAMVNAVTSFAGGPTSTGRALALVYFALAGLGLFGVAAGARHVDLDLRTRPAGRPYAVVVVGTLALAVVGGYASGSAFQARYASVVLVPLVLLVALGIATFADRKVRAGVLAAAVAFGTASSIPNIWTSRTQAGEVAATLASLGRPGDVVAFCPDQLGPAVSRLVPPGRYRMVTFPRGTPPQFVNWVDYAAASAAGDPQAFAARLVAMSAPAHQIWLVWAPGYQTFDDKCEALAGALIENPRLGAHAMFGLRPVANSWIAYEGMELLHLVHQP